ncbi:hypothetical protein H4R34_004673 [Dimargaris verticillata]|uniref:SMP-LTD domain-containing protein n=1 Tax=Dimargaris verticillata TaxID=2761393 RepID=A0A9W8B3Q8_9FUNG|nr:hypothetical protein H4R34_004673 [Dimargaris verticillata]
MPLVEALGSLVPYVVCFVLGVLFLPVCLFGGLTYLYYWPILPTASQSQLGTATIVSPDEHDRSHRQAEEAATVNQDDLATFHRVGWLRITREERSAQEVSNLAGLVKLGLTHIMETKQQQAQRKNKDLYYVVLKYDTLFMYDSEQQLECRGVVVMPMHQVTLHPLDLPDNEVFHRERPILLSERLMTDALQDNEQETKDNYYVYADTPVVKEDWYFALWRASQLGLGSKAACTLNTDAVDNVAALHDRNEPSMASQRAPSSSNRLDLNATSLNHLQQTINSNEHHLQTQWLNAVIGRVFLSINRTKLVKEYFINKMRLKITKLKKPSFLGDIEVRDLWVGNSAPTITNPRLLSLDSHGELQAEMYVHYSGGFRCEIVTEVQLSVTSRLKSLRVPLVLAVVLKQLTGKLLLKIKPAPTNRFWVGFYETPSMDLQIEPIVSEKQVKFAMVLQAIERRIYDMVNENIVLPNMDDTPFFPSHGSGGIFDEALVPPSPHKTPASTTDRPELSTKPSAVALDSELPELTGATPAAASEIPSSEKPTKHLSNILGLNTHTAAAPKLRGRSSSHSVITTNSATDPSAESCNGDTKQSGSNESSSTVLSLLRNIKNGQPSETRPPPRLPICPDISDTSRRRSSVGEFDRLALVESPPPVQPMDLHRRRVSQHSMSESPSSPEPMATPPLGNTPPELQSPLGSPLVPPSRAHFPLLTQHSVDSTVSPTHHRGTTSASFPPGPDHGSAQGAAAARPMGRGQPIPHRLPMGQGHPHSEAYLHSPYIAKINGKSGQTLPPAAPTTPSTRRSWLAQLLPDGKKLNPAIPDKTSLSDQPSITAAADLSRPASSTTVNSTASASHQSTMSEPAPTGQPPIVASAQTSTGSHPSLSTHLSSRFAWLNASVTSLKEHTTR